MDKEQIMNEIPDRVANLFVDLVSQEVKGSLKRRIISDIRYKLAGVVESVGDSVHLEILSIDSHSGDVILKVGLRADGVSS